MPVLLGCMIAASVFTFALVSSIAPRFQAETQLTITAKSTNPYGTGNNDAGVAAAVTPRLDPAAINTHVRALMAPDLLLDVGRSLNLAKRAEFNSAVGAVDTFGMIKRMLGLGLPRPGETDESRMLTAMQKNLVVSAARESRFLTIRFTSTDPQVAADVANAIAATYRKSLREIPVRETNDAVAALLPKIEQLNREVFNAEAAAKRFRAETDQLTGGSTSLTLQQQRLTALNADLVQAEAERSKSEARLSAARELSNNGAAETLPEVRNSRIIQDLSAQRLRVERQVNEASAVLLPAHPRMRQLNADLAGVRRSLNAAIRTIVNSISKEVRLAQLRTKQIRSQIADLKQQAVDKSGDEAKLRSLEATALSKRNELQRLQKQLEDNRTVIDTNRVPVESTIVSTARANKDAVFPKKSSLTLLAMAATLMLGLFYVIARALMAAGSAVPHNRRASDKAGSKLNGVTDTADSRMTGSGGDGSAREPELAGSSRSRTDVPRSGATAANISPIAAYARRFISAQSEEGGYRLLIAGDVNGVDPSDEAIELAAELSDAGGRVLLIDWSLSGVPLLDDIKVGNAASLAELVDERARFEDATVSLSDTNVHYVYASRQAHEPQLRDEAGLNLVLDAFDEAYDHVVVFGRHDDACALFETIEGRFDAGLIISDQPAKPPETSRSKFLGFEVADIEIIHHVRGDQAPDNGPGSDAGQSGASRHLHRA
jgi:tyrosine-protein kinase Etk/Wzc